MRRLVEKVEDLSSDFSKTTAEFAKQTALFEKELKRIENLQERNHCEICDYCLFINKVNVIQRAEIEELRCVVADMNEKIDEMCDWIQMMDDKDEIKERHWRQKTKQREVIDQ